MEKQALNPQAVSLCPGVFGIPEFLALPAGGADHRYEAAQHVLGGAEGLADPHKYHLALAASGLRYVRAKPTKILCNPNIEPGNVLVLPWFRIRRKFRNEGCRGNTGWANLSIIRASRIEFRSGCRVEDMPLSFEDDLKFRVQRFLALGLYTAQAALQPLYTIHLQGPRATV